MFSIKIFVDINILHFFWHFRFLHKDHACLYNIHRLYESAARAYTHTHPYTQTDTRACTHTRSTRTHTHTSSANSLASFETSKGSVLYIIMFYFLAGFCNESQREKPFSQFSRKNFVIFY